MPVGDRATTPGAGIRPAATRGRPLPASQQTFTKKYTVVGPRDVGGVKTGNDVTLTLTKDQETHLIQAGHLQISTR